MKKSLKVQATRLYEQGLSYNEISKQLNCSKGTLSYHLSELAKVKPPKIKKIKVKKQFEEPKYILSPYSQVVKMESCNLSGFSSNLDGDSKKCKYCGNPNNSKGSACNTCISRIRRFNFKQKAVNYLGGQCLKCGYNTHIAALEFHHPEKNKEFSISSRHNRKWEVLVKELDKCVLLCSNCHRIEHSKYEDFIINN